MAYVQGRLNSNFEMYETTGGEGLETVSTSQVTTTQVYNMYSTYIHNSGSGFSVSGNIEVKPFSSNKGYSLSAGNLVERSYNGTANLVITNVYTWGGAYGKGRFLFVEAHPATANPVNGSDGLYWYIRLGLAETAKVISPGGGETLDKTHTITLTKTFESEGLDLNRRPGLVDVELSLDNGLTWKRLKTDIEETSFNYNFINERETSLARFRSRLNAVDGLNIRSYGDWTLNDGIFTIRHDFAPTIPSNLKPKNVIIDNTVINRLEWKHNHPNPQSKFKLEWSTNQTLWNIIEQNTTREYIDISINTFPAGNIYWRVTTWSDAGIPSLVSNTILFTSAIPSDAPIITSDNTTILARPVVSWSQADQLMYQIKILDSIGIEVWDSGEITSNNKAVMIGNDLLNNSIYTIKVRTKTTLGLWTEYTSQDITVSYTAPMVPTFELICGSNLIAINIGNPTPTSNEPYVSYNDIYRDGIRIATNIQNNYKDYTVRSGQEHHYQIKAMGENGTISGSIYKSCSIILEHNILTDIQGNILELDIVTSKKRNIEYESSTYKFNGRKFPTKQFGEGKTVSIAITAELYEFGDLDTLERMFDQNNVLLLRDERGDKTFGTVSSYTSDYVLNFDSRYTINFTFQEVDFNEVV